MVKQTVLFQQGDNDFSLVNFKVGYGARGINYSSHHILSLKKTEHAYIMTSSYGVNNSQGHKIKLLDTILKFKDLKSFLLNNPSFSDSTPHEHLIELQDFIYINMSQGDFIDAVKDHCKNDSKYLPKTEKTIPEWFDLLSNDKNSIVANARILFI